MPRVSPIRSCLACRTDLSFENFDTNLSYHWSVHSCVESISIPCGDDADQEGILPESVLILCKLVSEAGGGRPCLPSHKPGSRGKLGVLGL